MAHKTTLFSLIFIIFIILSSLLSNIILCYSSLEALSTTWGKPANDLVSKFEKRIACIKDRVPKFGLVGYVSDRAPIEFVLTAYTLSPLFVEVKQYNRPPHFVEDTGKHYEFVIENSRNTRDTLLKERGHYAEPLDCANGVRLYRKMRK